MLRSLLILLTLLTSTGVTYALDPRWAITQYGHDVWLRQNGLPATAIYQAYPSPTGYLWLATNAGLVRFDGASFKVVPISNRPNAYREGVSVILETNSSGFWVGTTANGLRLIEKGIIREFGKNDGLEEEIRALYQSTDGQLWVGTANGLFVYTNQQFQRVPTTHDFICGITQGSDGTMYIAHHGGVDIFYGKQRRNISSANGLPSLRVWAIATDRHGNIWIGTEHGLCLWRNGQLVPVSFSTDPTVKLASCFREDKDGNLWVGTRNGGLYRLTNGIWTNITKQQGLTNNSVFTISEDREGSIWIATNEGLNRLRNVNIVPFTLQEGLASESLRSIVEGHDGSLYFLNDVAGYNSVRKNGIITNLPGVGGPSYATRDGSVWVAGTAGLQQMHGTASKTFLPELKGQWISCVAEDNLSIVFFLDKVGLRRLVNGKIEPYYLKDGAPYDNKEYHVTLFRDSRGILWAGTTGGVVKLDNGVATSFTTKEGLSDNFISSVEETSDGSVWFSTMRGGLTRYRDGKLTSYTVAQGLYDNQALRVLDDRIGNLWISTPRGLFTLSLKEIAEFDAGQTRQLHPRVFGIADGMKTDQCTFDGSNAGWRSQDGMLWFATAKGAVMVNPRQLVTNPTAPPVLIEEVHVDGKVFSPTTQLNLAPGTSDIEIQYTGLSLLAPDKVLFKYKLEGFDHDWVNADSRRNAFYTYLPPGTYKFRVMACNSDGVWAEARHPLIFRIQPQFSQTWWFYLLGGSTFLALGYAILRWRTNHLKQRETELSAHVASRTQELRLEITERQRAEQELHEAKQFLNNVLDNVPNLIFVKDAEGKFKLANRALAQMYGTTPQQMQGKSDADFNHQPEEIEQIQAADREVLTQLVEKIIPEEKITDAQGVVHWYHTAKRPLLLNNATERMLLGVATDFTERRQLESQLRHAQKLEAIGQIAAGVAHEINTPTQFVGDNTRFVRNAFQDIQLILEKFSALLTSLKNGESAATMVSDIETAMEQADVEYLAEEIPMALAQSLDGVSRIANIVRSMKDFAHPGATEKNTADLNRAIRSTVTVAHNEWKYVAETDLQLDDSLPPVPCYLGELNQVILNMIINATHAIEDVVGEEGTTKGKITIQTKQVDQDWVEIRISDTGKGIPPDIRSRIFDPFFTTKEVGKGTGQGLAISHTVIVEKHKGQIELESEVGQGTTFILRLPLS